MQSIGVADDSEKLHDILSLVRIRSGHDFSACTQTILARRVVRRMLHCDSTSIAEYHGYLREHPPELARLLRELQIGATSFFRDADAFRAVADHLPDLFANRGPDDQVRVWVAGCATGEEAYSIGMLLLEHASTLAEPPQLQVFATDLDDDSLVDARIGNYTTTIAADVSAERLERFFVTDGETLRVGPALRELVVFSKHDLMCDPPFPRLDLVSCRNVLSELDRDARSRMLSMFHAGLRPDGRLFLGASEGLDSATMFSTIDAANRIYGRRTIEDELQRTRDELQSTIDQYEISLDELEEQATINQELEGKLDEVSRTASELQDVLTSTGIPLVLLGRALEIKWFTPSALDLFNMITSDIGRPLAHLTHRLDTNELPELAQSALHDLRTIERAVTSRDGGHYLVRFAPYRSADRVDGVVLTFVDVSDLYTAMPARRT